MTRRTRIARLVALGLGVALVVGGAALPGPGRGQDQPAELAPPPAGRDLLRQPPFDRVVLVDGTELLVDPVNPRPLPDPHEEERRRAKARSEPRKTKGGILIGGRPEAPEDDREGMIALHTLEPEAADFLVRATNIRRVDYFEDLLLAEAVRLADRGTFDRAFEHLLAVQSRDPAWPGLTAAADRLLFLEGEGAVRGGDEERGLRLLAQLYKRQPGHPGLADLLGSAYAARIAAAFDAGAFALARSEWRALRGVAPDHPEVAAGRQRFERRAAELADRAEALQGADRTELLVEALRVWPYDPDLADRYATAFRAAPVLDVAVVDLPRRLGPWIRTEADRRVSRLLYLPILAEDSEEAVQGEPADQVVARLTVGDLGRRLAFRVRDGITWNDGSRPVGAVDLARTLSDRALPSAPAYQASWADLVQGVSVTGESEVEVTLNRAPLNLGSWLLGPVGPAHAAFDGRVWTPGGTRALGTGPFTPAREGEPLARFDRVAPDAPPIARIRERPSADPSAGVDELLRGDVTMLGLVPPHRVADLRAAPGIKVGRYRQVGLHYLALDGRNPALRNRSLRRALSYAVDRPALLEESVLGRAPDGDNAPSDGPFPRGSYADAPGVASLDHDRLLARMLVAAARRELGGEPIVLRLEYPATAVARRVVPLIAEAYREVGLGLELVERPPTELELELREGRRFDLAYRTATAPEPARDAGPLLCPGYDAPASADGLGAVVSPRILQLLLELERAQDWPTARGLVVAIDRESRDELPIVPLWQLEDHYAWRDRLSGPAETTDLLYEGLESWSIAPWFARDPE